MVRRTERGVRKWSPAVVAAAGRWSLPAVLLVAIATPAAAQSLRIDPSNPGIYQSTPAAVLDLGTRFLRRIEDETGNGGTTTRNPDGGGAPAEEVQRRFRTWAEAYGLHAHLSDTHGLPGDTRRTWGLVAGLAYTLAPGATLGFAVDQGWTDVDVNGLPQSGRINLIQFGVNASFELGAWTLGLAAIHGRGDIETRNATSVFMGVPGVARADFEARLWGAIGEAGTYIPLGDDARLVPKLGFDWQHTETDGFTETGIPNPVTVAAQSGWRVRGFAGFEVGRSFASHAAVLDLAAYARAVEILAQELPVATVSGGGAPPATFQGLSESRFGMDAGASVSLRLSELIRLYLLYDGRFRGNFQSHAGTAGLELRW